MRRLAISTYSSLNSIPMALRPNCAATIPDVPLPKNGSMIVAGTGLALHLHDGCQLCDVILPFINPERERVLAIGTSSRPAAYSDASLAVAPVRSITLSHGAAHCEHTPFSLVPARMARRGISEGNAA